MQHERNLLTTQRTHFPFPEEKQVATVHQDRAACSPLFQMQQPENGKRERALSAPALAHQSKDFSGLQIEHQITQDGISAGIARGQMQGQQSRRCCHIIHLRVL